MQLSDHTVYSDLWLLPGPTHLCRSRTSLGSLLFSSLQFNPGTCTMDNSPSVPRRTAGVPNRLPSWYMELSSPLWIRFHSQPLASTSCVCNKQLDTFYTLLQCGCVCPICRLKDVKYFKTKTQKQNVVSIKASPQSPEAKEERSTF